MAEPVVVTPAGAVPLWLWVQHHGVWPRVAEAFCAAVTADRDVAGYLRELSAEEVRQHCAQVLTTLCAQGLTESRLRALVAAHRSVTDAGGRPVTGLVVDRVAAALRRALAAEGVPVATIAQVAAVGIAIRDALTGRRSVRGIRRRRPRWRPRRPRSGAAR